MAILSLMKVSIVGPDERHSSILNELQGLGCLHLIDTTSQPLPEQPESSEKAADALKYLAASPQQRRQRKVIEQPLGALLEEVLVNKRQRADKIDEIELIRQHIQALKPWGEFRFSALDEMGDYRLWFYQVPLFKLEQLESCPYAWQEVARDHRQHYVVVVAKEEPTIQQVPFVRVHTGDRCYAELIELLERAEWELDDLDAEREALTAWRWTIQEWINDFRDCEAREHAALQRRQDDESGCFVIQAWVAEKSLNELEQLCRKLNVAMVQSTPEPEEEPPILLQNPTTLKGAEAVVSFFQLPGYRSWDPTPVVFFSFAFFFAMILSDAGYAALLGGIVLLRWRKWGRSDTGAKLRGLLVAIIAASVIYGVLVGSYFGMSPPENSMLAWLQLLNMNDFDSMMLLSLVIGVLHLLIANAIKSFMVPGGFQTLAPWGWNALIGGGFIVWYDYVYLAPDHWLQNTGSVSMVVGALVVLLCSGQRVVARLQDAPLRLLDGVKALYNISKAFGDVLSYLRLFALGLASASLALTFNQLAIQARDSVEHGGVILFLLVLIAGHGLNLVLGVMSGVIHGLRLNLLEFYNWGVEGEGTPFKAFRKRGR